MRQALKTSLFQDALTAIDALSLDNQAALIDVLNNRLKLRQRQQVIKEVREFE
jgi:hypothetical protein